MLLFASRHAALTLAYHIYDAAAEEPLKPAFADALQSARADTLP